MIPEVTEIQSLDYTRSYLMIPSVSAQPPMKHNQLIPTEGLSSQLRRVHTITLLCPISDPWESSCIHCSTNTGNAEPCQPSSTLYKPSPEQHVSPSLVCSFPGKRKSPAVSSFIRFTWAWITHSLLSLPNIRGCNSKFPKCLWKPLFTRLVVRPEIG